MVRIMLVSYCKLEKENCGRTFIELIHFEPKTSCLQHGGYFEIKKDDFLEITSEQHENITKTTNLQDPVVSQ